MTDREELMLESLVEGPLLLGDLPEAPAFDHSRFSLPHGPAALCHEQKLGHLYEDALALLLQDSPYFSLLARNLQLREGPHRTIGELDFLVRDEERRAIIHLELAVKFYLVVRNTSGVSLPGPDARDNYFRKVKRLRTHQLTLTSRHCALLPPLLQEHPFEARHLVYGCLFLHIDDDETSFPEFMNPAARTGRWLHLHQVWAHFSRNTRPEVIPKPLWPVPPSRLRNIQLAAWDASAELDRCVMVRVPGECTPFFIAPDHYPEMAIS